MIDIPLASKWLLDSTSDEMILPTIYWAVVVLELVRVLYVGPWFLLLLLSVLPYSCVLFH